MLPAHFIFSCQIPNELRSSWTYFSYLSIIFANFSHGHRERSVGLTVVFQNTSEATLVPHGHDKIQLQIYFIKIYNVV